MATLRALRFVGRSFRDLTAFPVAVRQDAGRQLRNIQLGREPDDWKPMTSIGAGVNEIRLRDRTGAYRVIYIAKLEDAIYVLHCFEKKSQKTAKRDIDLAAARLGDVLRR